MLLIGFFARTTLAALSGISVTTTNAAIKSFAFVLLQSKHERRNAETQKLIAIAIAISASASGAN